MELDDGIVTSDNTSPVRTSTRRRRRRIVVSGVIIMQLMIIICCYVIGPSIIRWLSTWMLVILHYFMNLVSDEAEDVPSADDNSIDKKCEPSSSATQLNYIDAEPGPSNVRSSLSTTAALHSSVDSMSGISTPHSPSEQDASPASLDNYDADADFPRWMRLTQPLRFPYIAQIGDEVVYFRQGRFIN